MIVRAIALKNASVTGTVCACAGPGVTGPTVVDLGQRGPGVNVYAGLQLLSSTAGGIKVWVQAATSSQFTALNPGRDIVAYTSRTCRDSQWASVPWNCASATSTEDRYYRAAWTQTCDQTNVWIAALSVGD